MKKNYLLLFFLVLFMVIFFAGCKDSYQTQTYTSSNITTSDTTTSDTKTEEQSSEEIIDSQEAINVDTEDSVTPLSIETPAGAVIVGIIKNDSDGWYLVPEQPINVTLNYYIDNPESFDKQTKINMHEVDSFNYNLYRDKTVTVSGMLQNYRGAGTLYIYPCLIEYGKTVDKSYAFPELDYPEEKTSGDYNPSAPIPEKMKPVIKNGNYLYNPYSLTENTLERMGNAYIDFYISFVDAWLSYKTSCPCPEKLYADFFTSVMFYEFPLFTADGKYDMMTGYDSETKTLHWSYTSKNKTEHDRIISEFEDSVNSILKSVKPTDSEQERAQSLYHAFCPLMDYDKNALETGVNTEPYYAFNKNKGVCITFAGALSLLFNQIGIKGTIASSDTTNGIGHTWNVINIDGKNYFCDATYELEFKNGSAYAYFGMSLNDRLSDGSIIKDSISIGFLNTYTLDEYDISDTSLTIK